MVSFEGARYSFLVLDAGVTMRFYNEKGHRANCKGCGRFMPWMYIECNVFPLCSNKGCSEYGKWPESTKSLQKYLKEVDKRGSFCHSITP